jgi:elongation factor P--(R)-beta-lysine ligase
MSNEHWQPVASKDRMFARADLLKRIRSFFELRGALEVETPILSHAAGTDPNLDPIPVSYRADTKQQEQTLFLQTSPEFAMKRLLASGSGAIFQICKSFRNAEQGARHNPEFTLLEWYQPGFNEQQLMDEVMALVQFLLESLSSKNLYFQENWQRLSYQSVFENHLGLNPHTASVEDLEKRANAAFDIEIEHANKDVWLDLLFSHLIEPQLQEPVFIYDYPATQAALAKIEKNPDGIEVARRFELVIKGMEIANGYYELTDEAEQRKRFTHDQEEKSKQGLMNNPLDENLLAAMQSGLPDCSGVALGIDRLLMLICDASTIDEVLTFPLNRA